DSVIIRSKEKNKYFTFQWDKVKHIFLFLKDLYDTHALNKKGSLKLSYYEAPYLAEIADAQHALDLRWFGDKKIAELGKKLHSFTGINASILPDNFKAFLRPYQKEGVDWLQFLRAHQLSGILADDMGLGKTVQTLAHLSIEKKEGRLTKPALVIAPTSLMVNWEAEAQRFTPDLKVLVLHGATRKNHYDKIIESDIVFTTYSLLSRDKEKLLHHYFHSIILDEAHRIKNNKTQTTQIVYQLKADHRFCLTGTPLENHLGELWSIYHFSSPGFLGNEKQFKDQYRNPIERDNDENRRKLLIRRIKPFLLRRTKEKVIHELPAKTEIIQRCVLEKDQRDLYETIRVAMDQKVQAEIAQKGLARSHITILDALLKLRQVCCDPRLLKLEHAQKVKHSAKLELLMEMLPEMIEEGRKILLFSQFTSMLDLIKEALHKENIPYVTLTGSTLDRKKPVEEFQAGKVPLFLISLKAGGVGLNLTAADTVIHYDPWWNPAVESQATDRAHRIGQQKAVFVYKFIVSDTVEEKILHMQNHKRALASALFDEDGQAAHKLSADDIKTLFEKI
ncbi:MAG: DEAD/DEAH box helicase, partial [Alphaproteobacteria bacterium]|nr:DEAD/DEAH box helicase [Alphaproteobacteria bacterium]